MRHHRPAAIALAAALALGAVSCSSDDDGSDSSTSTTTEAPAATSTAPATSDDPVPSSLPEPLDDQTAPESINGLTVDGDTLWIASIGGDQVLRVDRRTGQILARHHTTGAGPDDVAVAPDGSVWVTGFEGGILGRIADGTYEEVATLAAGINGIDVDDDGTVWVATMATDGQLWRVPAGGGSPEAVASGLDMVNAFEVDPSDGTILAPAGGFEAGWIARIDPADGSVTPVVEGLPSVMASTWHPDGRFIALANVTGELIAVDPEGGTFEVIATVTDGAPFDNLAYAEDGTLYISSFVTPTVTEVKPDGSVRVIPIGSAAAGG